MKILRAIVLLVTGIIWISGCSTTLLNEFYRSELIPDDYRYGDLYRLSNLIQFKDPKEKCSPYFNAKKNNPEKIALYLIGDSFTEQQRIGKADFFADTYQYAHWATQLHLKLDTTYTNIIVLESVERKVREHFISPISNIFPGDSTYITIPEDARLVNRLDQLFMATSTEERLSTILFQFEYILKIKELKSWINFHFFERTDPKVTVSKDGEVLSYIEETDSSLFTSSFNFVAQSEIDSIVRIINFDNSYLKKLGFDKVFLAIIPNKTSVLMPDYGIYNHLLEKIENHSSLEVPVLSIFKDFNVMNECPYLKGDSHWSCAGQYRWLEKANKYLLLENNIK